MILKKLTILLFMVIFLNKITIANAVQLPQLNFASIESLKEQRVAKIVLPQIYHQLDRNIIITPLPANRAQQEANSGAKDGEILRIYSYGLETPNVIRVATPYYYLTTAAFTVKNAKIILNELTDLAHYRVGIVRGVKHTNNATKGLKNVYQSKNSLQLFRQLALGNIDIALTNYHDGLYTMKKLHTNTFKVIDKALVYEPLYHYIHKKHAALVNPVNRIIKQLKASSKLDKMIQLAENKIY